ncbi:MAG TPA: hypothetical protein ENJ95_20785 [Bacteroidetes bacterium]|nr:hypothetical protein [Bacteroidota bacterium]
MKNIIAFIFFAFFISGTMAQSKAGVIREFKDFMNGSYVEYQEYRGIRHVLGNFTVIFKNRENEKIKFKTDHKKMWGFVADDGRIFRVDDNNKPSVIMLLGDIVVYGNYTTKIEDGNATMVVNQYTEP